MLSANMAAASHAARLIQELPVLARILLEIQILVAALIENELRLINLPLQNKIIEHAGLGATYAGRDLGLVYDPVHGDGLALLLLEEMLFVGIRINLLILFHDLVKILRFRVIFKDVFEFLGI